VTRSTEAAATGLRIPAPERLYYIEYSTGEPGDPWERMESPWRSIRHALAWFNHLTRTNPVDSYRVVTEEGRTVVMLCPGQGASA